MKHRSKPLAAMTCSISLLLTSCGMGGQPVYASETEIAAEYALESEGSEEGLPEDMEAQASLTEEDGEGELAGSEAETSEMTEEDPGNEEESAVDDPAESEGDLSGQTEMEETGTAQQEEPESQMPQEEVSGVDINVDDVEKPSQGPAEGEAGTENTKEEAAVIETELAASTEEDVEEPETESAAETTAVRIRSACQGQHGIRARSGA